MATLLTVLATTLSLTRSQPYFVAYVDYPTCSGIGTGSADANCLAALGVPGYSNHKYNVINFAFYVTYNDQLYDAAKVWANPSIYFTSTFRDQISGKSGSTDAEFRAAVKRMNHIILSISNYENIF